MFICTDNDVSEACYYYATSTLQELFELIVHLKLLELRGGIKVHIIRVAETHHIASRIDGFSRRNLSKGIMQGGACGISWSWLTLPMCI